MSCLLIKRRCGGIFSKFPPVICRRLTANCALCGDIDCKFSPAICGEELVAKRAWCGCLAS